MFIFDIGFAHWLWTLWFLRCDRCLPMEQECSLCFALLCFVCRPVCLKADGRSIRKAVAELLIIYDANELLAPCFDFWDTQWLLSLVQRWLREC